MYVKHLGKGKSDIKWILGKTDNFDKNSNFDKTDNKDMSRSAKAKSGIVVNELGGC